MAASLVGQRLGKYEITQLIGHGGMATVYKAHQSDIDRNVAIKVLPPHPGQDSQFVERFRLEARTIARLQHPHIVPLYDYGDERDILYLVMAFIDGGSVSDRIRRGAMPPREVEVLIKQIAGALDYAHRQGIIHRDIKPDNILLDREGHALLADFGIVRLIGGAPSGSSLTVTGGLVGTPAYMSPEQAQGLSIDGRTDLYSLGVVTFEMLTGKQPFMADTPMQVVFKHVSAPIPPIRDMNPALPPDVEAVMRRILAKQPGDRYPTAQAFADELGMALRGELGQALEERATFVFPAGTAPTNPATSTPPLETGQYPGYGQTPPPGTGQYPPPGTGQYPPPGTGQYPPTGQYPSYGQTPPPGMGQYPTYPPGQYPTPTIITQQGTNPLVLLGGFAIIAILLIVVVIVVINQNRPGDGRGAPPLDTLLPQDGGFEIGIGAPIMIMPTPAMPMYGRVNFSTTDHLGDTLSLQLMNVNAPRAGQVYTAWLQNTATAEVLRLGTINLDALGNGTLNYQSPDAVTLPTTFNQVVIGVDDPATGAAYSGGIPVEVADALRAILIGGAADATPEPTSAVSEPGYEYDSPSPASTTPSLIDAALTEAEIAARHSGLAAGATSVGSMRVHSEHTINALSGTTEDYDGNGRGENPASGVGVMYYVNAMWDRLNAAVNTLDSNFLVQSQAELIRICLANVSDWTDQVIALERDILAADSLEAVQDKLIESTTLAETIVAGVDLNGNGRVDPFEGECGLQQIVDYGISVGNMMIYAASDEG